MITLLESFGDIVACEPIARELKRRDPNCFLVWGVKPAFRELVTYNPHLDLVLDVHCLSGRLLLSRSCFFDEVVDLHFYDRYCSLCRKPLRRPVANGDLSLATYFLQGNILTTFGRAGGLQMRDEPPVVYIPEAYPASVGRLLPAGPFIVIHCCSNSIEKDWPMERWRELLEDLRHRNTLPVIEIGAESIFSESPPEGVKSLCGMLTFMESAEVIRRGSLFIGIDSGPAHLANAVGTYGIVLIGSYLGFDRYNPFGGAYGRECNIEIIHADGLVATIPVERVTDAVVHTLTSLK